jgi:hypothetical protein
MACFIVSYDLHKEAWRDYDKLIAAIRAAGSSVMRIHESVWGVVSAGTANQLYEHLRPYTHTRDSLFVVMAAKDAQWSKFNDPRDAWLLKNVVGQ